MMKRFFQPLCGIAAIADPAPLLGVFGAGVAVVGAALRVRHLLRRRH